MSLPFFHVDAFANAPFRGNPAGVVPLEQWLDEPAMRAIAAENSLPATAFFVREPEGWRIRWFTPSVELELCGHATLASAWVILTRLWPELPEVAFASRGGTLRVTRDGERLALDFPALPATPGPEPATLKAGLGVTPKAVLKAVDLLVILESESQVRGLKPDTAALNAIETRGIIVTAPGSESDYVSRFFAPRVGLAEDPATGSAQCTLVPYWAERLGRDTLHARQLSARGGEFWCERAGDRVRIAGHVSLYSEGAIRLP